ncbi:MAG: hypothetical protein JNL82_30810 [Myxococcales bacterium]|nr:hypothetical protein [Myxococcales bacterium]
MRRSGEIVLCCAALSCGDATGGDAGGGASTGTTALSIFATDTPVPTSDGPKLDIPGDDLPPAGCGPVNGDLGLSYIWIANSTEGTISKIDTVDMVERGRYIVRPDSAGDPSRTSVNLTGDVAVANRNGGITKVYALAERCADSNGTPGVQTAHGPDFLAWGEEECVAWHTPLDYKSQRPVAWTQGTFDSETCRHVGQKLWTSGSNTPGVVDILRLDGDTGVVEHKITVEGVLADSYGIYGGAVDRRGNFWGSQVGHGKLLFVDADTLEHKLYDSPHGAYGITLDAAGRVWLCSGNAQRFDPASETWQTAPAGEYGGCMEDGAGTLYKATPGGIAAVDTDTLEVVATYALPTHIHGISVDFHGYVWGVSQGSEAYRLDPADGSFETIGGLVGAYTYSDMTGFALSNQIVP